VSDEIAVLLGPNRLPKAVLAFPARSSARRGPSHLAPGRESVVWHIGLMYTDAAPLYDLIHEAKGRDAGAEANVFIREIRQRNPGARTLLDVACGTGANLPRFAESFEVMGLDASEHMVRLAQERCPEVEFVTADMRNFDLGRRFDAIVSLFSGVGYLVEESDLREAVSTMAKHLNPGGVLMLEGWVEVDQWLGSAVSVDSCQTDNAAIARVTRSGAEGMRSSFTCRYTVATNEGIDTIDEHHVMRLADPDEFVSAYGNAGLTFERLPNLLRAGRAVYVGVAGN
jgi:SAM-dependent methyltransferase